MNASVVSDPRGRKFALEPCLEPCPIERGMRLLGGKWKGSILWHLKDGPVRFNDLAPEHVDHISGSDRSGRARQAGGPEYAADRGGLRDQRIRTHRAGYPRTTQGMDGRE